MAALLRCVLFNSNYSYFNSTYYGGTIFIFGTSLLFFICVFRILNQSLLSLLAVNMKMPYLKKKWIRWNWWSPWKDTNLVFFKGCLFSCCLVWFTWNRSGKTWTLFRWIWWNCCLLQWSGKSIHQGYSVNSFAVLLVFEMNNILMVF